MKTTEHKGAGDGWVMVVLAALVAVVGAVMASQSVAGAHDHGPPDTVLKKGARELQAGTRVIESSWTRPAPGDLCEHTSVFYTTRFPETDRVAAGSKLRVRIFKSQRPDSFGISAYREVDENGTPVGEGRALKRSLERVSREGKTVAWDAVFSVNRPGRDYYLIGEGHWQDRQGCEADQFAHWSFHVKTRAA